MPVARAQIPDRLAREPLQRTCTVRARIEAVLALPLHHRSAERRDRAATFAIIAAR
jgi:hypothetical protein